MWFWNSDRFDWMGWLHAENVFRLHSWKNQYGFITDEQNWEKVLHFSLQSSFILKETYSFVVRLSLVVFVLLFFTTVHLYSFAYLLLFYFLRIFVNIHLIGITVIALLTWHSETKTVIRFFIKKLRKNLNKKRINISQNTIKCKMKAYLNQNI